MAGKPTDADLMREVLEAVANISEGETKAALVKRFLGRGVSRATLYIWIDRAIQGAALHKVKGHGPAADDVAARAALAGKALSPAPRRTGGIEFEALLQETLGDLRLLRAMAMSDDGKIRNPRMLLETAEKIGRTLDRAARIGALIRGHEELDAFLETLMDAIKAEGPQVWGRVSSRMREVNKAHGYFRDA